MVFHSKPRYTRAMLNRTALFRVLIFAACIPALCIPGHFPAPALADDAPPLIPYEVLSVQEHDPEAFTQGLAWIPSSARSQGRLFESTGLWGRSSIRELDPATGKVLRSDQLPAIFFGEGLAVYNNTLVQLTWKSGRGFRRDPDSLKKISGFEYSGEGWGLALCPAPHFSQNVTNHSGSPMVLVRSDGSSFVHFHDPETFAELGGTNIEHKGTPINLINELECIEGKLFFNIWHSDDVGVADLASGEVLGRLDFSPLREKLPSEGGALNGLAYDPASRELRVTGKNWPEMFIVRIPSMYEKP